MTFMVLAVVIFALSCLLTATIRKNARRNNLIDIPNLRSSHTEPTPRGGGAAIVVGFFAALLLLVTTGIQPPGPAFVLLTGSALIATLGFIDDRSHVPARWRLLGHFIAAIWILVGFAGFPPFVIFGFDVKSTFILGLFAVVYLVWVLNLYNFMDGIDGLAAGEALTACASMAFIYWFRGDVHLVYMPLALSCAVLGFIVWNFPFAKIFMGDVGSGFLGVTLASFSVLGAWVRVDYFWAWLIVLGVFIVDATITLLHRLLRRERIFEAHRSHAYQHASSSGRAHWPVTSCVILINVFWLFPIAYSVACGYIDGTIGIAIAYAPLVLLALKYRAGASEYGAS